MVTQILQMVANFKQVLKRLLGLVPLARLSQIHYKLASRLESHLIGAYSLEVTTFGLLRLKLQTVNVVKPCGLFVMYQQNVVFSFKKL